MTLVINKISTVFSIFAVTTFAVSTNLCHHCRSHHKLMLPLSQPAQIMSPLSRSPQIFHHCRSPHHLRYHCRGHCRFMSTLLQSKHFDITPVACRSHNCRSNHRLSPLSQSPQSQIYVTTVAVTTNVCHQCRCHHSFMSPLIYFNTDLSPLLVTTVAVIKFVTKIAIITGCMSPQIAAMINTQH